MMKSQRFIDTRTGEIVTQVPLSQIAHFEEYPNDADTWLACQECGCTDVETTAWVDVNTGGIINSEGPTDQTWCPQCEDESKTRFLKTVGRLKPFEAENPEVRQIDPKAFLRL